MTIQVFYRLKALGRPSLSFTLYVTTDGQSVSLSWNKVPIWGLQRDIHYRQTFAVLLMWGALWREDGSVVYNCCWPSPAQSFSGPSPVGFSTIFYCFRFEASLFVASYDSQGHGGGIRPRLHTGIWEPSLCKSYIRIQFLLHRKHFTSPLQSPTG
jgi:hypothetical protein